MTLPKLRIVDLVYDAAHVERLPLRGRTRELQKIARTLGRDSQSNLIISGQRGIGKTALLYGFIKAAATQQFSRLRPLPYVLLEVSSFMGLLRDAQKQEEFVAHARAAWQSLPASVVIIDEADQLMTALEPWMFEQLFEPFFAGERHVVFAVTNDGWETVAAAHKNSLKFFDTLSLPELGPKSCRAILGDHVPRLAQHYGVTITAKALEAVVEQLPRRAAASGAAPRAAIGLLDEACAVGGLRGDTTITEEHVAGLAAERSGMTMFHRSKRQRQQIVALPEKLRASVKGQDHVIATVAPLIQRGYLGLSNPSRPIGSFLFLGPSGVGKTELAKVLATELFGSPQAMVRLDMSEFSEAHMAARLLGAPPGYIGYDVGGQLTSPVAARPFSLVLLDEIEKAHRSVFDIFLQVLDDGRLTDGQGQTVDFSKTIIIATSNIGLPALIAAYERGEDVTTKQFHQTHMIPELLRHLRPEFLNRFEAVATFAPLSPAGLLEIARLEIAKIQQRVARHNVAMELPEDFLWKKVQELADPRFGARPLKRFIEQACEAAVARHLLQPQ